MSFISQFSLLRAAVASGRVLFEPSIEPLSLPSLLTQASDRKIQGTCYRKQDGHTRATDKRVTDVSRFKKDMKYVQFYCNFLLSGGLFSLYLFR